MSEHIKSVNKRVFIISLISLSISLIGFFLFWHFGDKSHINIAGINASSRLLTGFFGALLGAMVFIISLTSTTYTPRISTLFLHHPIAACGLGTIIFCEFVLVMGGFFPDSHPYYAPLMVFTMILAAFSIAIIMPYLYYLIHFIEPKFFLPILKKQVIDNLEDLHQNQYKANGHEKNIFDNINIIINVGAVAAIKDDQNLMILTFEMAQDILSHLIENRPHEKINWRRKNPQFLPGISEEGRFYLERELSWPEFFILGKIQKRVNALGPNQNEIATYVCEKLLETLDESVAQDNDELIDYHIMVLNSLLKKSLDTKNVERFQSICYYYRIAIEILSEKSKKMDSAAESFRHYANLADQLGLDVCTEAILFDLGKLPLFFALEDEEMGINFLNTHTGNTWRKFLKRDDHLGFVTWKSMVKAYWEASAKGYTLLAKIIMVEYLKRSDIKHKLALVNMFKNDREIFYELNDRLMNYSYLGPKARTMAKEYFDENLRSLVA